jgi:CheY-like chemotaxis protein
MHLWRSIPKEVPQMKSIALSNAAASPANDQTVALRILIAEDNDTMRRLLAFVLRADGHEIVEARRAILSEQTLPGLNGLTVLAGVRARGHATPFVLITADPDVQREARQLRGVVLDQPFNAQAIRAAVASSTTSR